MVLWLSVFDRAATFHPIPVALRLAGPSVAGNFHLSPLVMVNTVNPAGPLVWLDPTSIPSPFPVSDASWLRLLRQYHLYLSLLALMLFVSSRPRIVVLVVTDVSALTFTQKVSKSLLAKIYGYAGRSCARAFAHTCKDAYVGNPSLPPSRLFCKEEDPYRFPFAQDCAPPLTRLQLLALWA